MDFAEAIDNFHRYYVYTDEYACIYTHIHICMFVMLHVCMLRMQMNELVFQM